MTMDLPNAADDFFVNVSLQTTLALPKNRETVLHFFEAVQKQFPLMSSLYQRERGVFVLEGDRESGTYPWMEIESHRLSAGYFNPPQPDDAHKLHEWLLDRIIYYLGVSPLDVDSLDVLYGFNLDYKGNRDAIVAQALLGGSPLGGFLADSEAATIECEPGVVITLDEECYLQARLSLETRNSSFQVRTGTYDDEPISIYFTVRQFPRPGQVFDLAGGYPRQRDICEDYCHRLVGPQVLHPISATIAGTQ